MWDTMWKKPSISSVKMRVVSAAVALAGLVGMASADIAGDITNITTIIAGITGWVTSLMTLFMQPPLIYLVAVTFFLLGWRLVKGILIRRR